MFPIYLYLFVYLFIYFCRMGIYIFLQDGYLYIYFLQDGYLYFFPGWVFIFFCRMGIYIYIFLQDGYFQEASLF